MLGSSPGGVGRGSRASADALQLQEPCKPPPLRQDARSVSRSAPEPIPFPDFARSIGAGYLVAGPGELVSQQRMASTLGVSVRTIREWMGRGLPHETRRGKPVFPLYDCLRWWSALKVREGRRHFGPLSLEEARREMDRFALADDPGGFVAVPRILLERLRGCLVTPRLRS